MDDERNKTIFNWTRSIISIYNQLNNFPPPAQSFLERETKNNRGKRSEQQFSLESQFERFCRKKGSQPCTCFYPDHPNATHFEFDTDDTTRKALSGLNGSGPKSCEDLLNIGYKLNGYYFIRLNTQRARTVFCVFTNHSKIQISDSTLKESSEAMFVLPSKVKRLRFCGGIASIPCTFLYSDYPDATSNYHVENGPKNCEDLKDFGHSLKGFYVVRFNSKRMKVIFCDFKQTSAAEKEMQPQSAENCNAIGSKPCSCYLKNRGDIPQLELGTDDTTQKAITSNGISPENCEDLHQLGHILKGFYLVRMNRKSMKIIYCEFKIQIKNQNPAFEEREIYMTTEKTSKKQNGNVTKESMVESAKYSFSKEESQQQTQQSENDEVLFQRTSTAKIPITTRLYTECKCTKSGPRKCTCRNPRYAYGQEEWDAMDGEVSMWDPNIKFEELTKILWSGKILVNTKTINTLRPPFQIATAQRPVTMPKKGITDGKVPPFKRF